MPAGFDHASRTIAWPESVRHQNLVEVSEAGDGDFRPDYRTAPCFCKLCTYNDFRSFGRSVGRQQVNTGIFSSQLDLDILGSLLLDICRP
jgi:hypothetical protein